MAISELSARSDLPIGRPSFGTRRMRILA